MRHCIYGFTMKKRGELACMSTKMGDIPYKSMISSLRYSCIQSYEKTDSTRERWRASSKAQEQTRDRTRDILHFLS